MIRTNQLESKEIYKNFKNIVKDNIQSKLLINQKIEPRLPNPFTENDDVLERRNNYIRTGRDAYQDLLNSLGK